MSQAQYLENLFLTAQEAVKKVALDNSCQSIQKAQFALSCSFITGEFVDPFGCTVPEGWHPDSEGGDIG